jgi:hypothetical protein
MLDVLKKIRHQLRTSQREKNLHNYPHRIAIVVALWEEPIITDRYILIQQRDLVRHTNQCGPWRNRQEAAQEVSRQSYDFVTRHLKGSVEGRVCPLELRQVVRGRATFFIHPVLINLRSVDQIRFEEVRSKNPLAQGALSPEGLLDEVYGNDTLRAR